MNKIFKVVKNQRTGTSVVASELAKGVKKGAKLSLSHIALLTGTALLLGTASFAVQAENISLLDEYSPSVFDDSTQQFKQEANNHGKMIVIDDTKNKKNLNSQRNDLKNNRLTGSSVLTLEPNKEQFTQSSDYDYTYYTLEQLQKEAKKNSDILTIIKSDDKDNPVKDFSTLYDWDLTQNPTVQNDWENNDGHKESFNAYDTSKLHKKINPQLGGYVLKEQPEVSPFYKLTLAVVEDGKLSLDATKEIDWNIKAIKESSLFVADTTKAANTAAAKIEVDGKLHVTFGEAHRMDLSTGKGRYKIQPEFKLVKEIKVSNIDSLVGVKDLNGQVLDKNSVIAIKDDAGLNDFNNLLISAVKSNKLASAEYEHLFKLAFENTNSDDTHYLVDYDLTSLENKNIKLSEGMKEDIGHRSIFEVVGNNAKLVINKDASIQAKTNNNHGEYRAYNVYAHDGASVINKATTEITDFRGQNAFVQDADYSNEGSLIFAAKDNSQIFGDEVTGKKGSYINKGTISVEAANNKNVASHNDSTRNIALTVSEGAVAENMANGNINIGQQGIGKKHGTATGIFVTGGQFTNHKNANMTIGSENTKLLGGTYDHIFNVKTTSNAISAIADAQQNADIVINNDGNIAIKKGAINTVGLNVQSENDRSERAAINVNNNGEITVDGNHSVGMRVAGQSSTKDHTENNGVINVNGTDSIGIYALNGSKVIHSGTVIATNNKANKDGQYPDRIYAIRADKANVDIKKGSHVEIKGDNAVGVFARIGGDIKLDSNTEVKFDKNAENQVGYWIAGKLPDNGNTHKRSSAISFADKNVSLTIENKNSTLFRVDQKASFDGTAKTENSDDTKFQFNITGDNSEGFYIANEGTDVKTGNMELNVNSDNATGMYITSGAGADNGVILNKETQINVSGDNATIAVVDGASYDIQGNKITEPHNIEKKAKLISEAKLTSGGTVSNISEGAIGYKLINGGILEHQGQIDFSDAKDATGVLVEGGHLINNTHTEIKVNGVGVDIYKNNSQVTNAGLIEATDGIAAIRLNRDASMTITKDNGGKIIGSGSADGVRAHSGSILKLQGADIDVTGSGNGIHLLETNDGNSTKGHFVLAGSGVIHVNGKDGAGLRLAGEGKNKEVIMSSKNIDTSNATDVTIKVNANNAAGNGIKTFTSGDVNSGMNVEIASTAGQSALVVEGETKNITQVGKLTSNSEKSAVVNLTGLNNEFNFANSGVIKAAAKDKVAVDAKNNNHDLVFSNANEIEGKVLLGSGNNYISLSGSTSELNSGNGNNTLRLEANSATGLIELGHGKNDVVSSGKTDILNAGSGDNRLRLANTSDTGSINLSSGKNNIISAGKIDTLKARDGNNTLLLNNKSVTKTVNLGSGDNDVTLDNSAQLSVLALGSGNNIVTLKGGTTVNNAVAGESKKGNTFIIDTVTTEQGHKLFDNLSAGKGTNDTLVLKGENSHYQLTDSNKINSFESLHIEQGTFELNNADISLAKNKITDGIDISKDARLYINADKTKKSIELGHQMQGNGLIETSSNNQAVSFNNESAKFASKYFNGTLKLTNGTYDLAGDNTTALAKSTLDIGHDAIVTVRENEGRQSFDSLAISGGTLALKDNVIGSKKLDGHIHVNDLKLENAQGVVKVTANGFDNLPTPDVDRKLPLLEHDNGKALVTLVDADKASVSAGGLTLELMDKDGKSIDIAAQDTVQDLRQNGEKVADATYGYGLQTKDGNSKDGLFVAYKLKQIDLQGHDDKALILSAAKGTTGASADLSANITGNGSLAIDTDNQFVSLSNHNDYKGATQVRRGGLQLNADNALGNTELLDMASDTKVTLMSSDGNGTEQTIGKLNTALSSDLMLGNGTLTIQQGGLVNGHIHGNNQGQLTLENDTLIINGANNTLHSSVAIASNAKIALNDVAGLGNSNVNVEGKLAINNAKGQLKNSLSDKGFVSINDNSDVTLASDNSKFNGTFVNDKQSTLRVTKQNNLGHAVVENQGNFVVTHNDTTDKWSLNNSINGTGSVTKQGAGILALTHNSAQYTGLTDIQNGTLLAGSENNALVLNSRLVNIADKATFAATGQAKGDVNNAGTFIVGDLNKETLDKTTNYRVNGDFVNNGGNILLASQKATGSRLNVGGDFTANGGSITLNTVLNKGHEQTQTDQLVVAGDVKTGVNGPTTLNIKAVGGEGANTREQPDAIKVVHVGGNSTDNAFKLGAPVGIGLYEYQLHKGYGDDSWYLDSYDNAVYPKDENPKQPIRNISPVIGSYLANQTAAMGMFSMTLHDRLGEPGYSDSLKGDEDATSVWLRIIGDRQRHNAGSDMLRLKGNTYTTQLGGDIISWNDEQDATTRVGAMAAIGKSDYTSRSKTTGSESKGKIDRAYSLGLYATWYQNKEHENNAYVDVWTQYSWFNNQVSMSDNESNYKSNLLSASIEAGYAFNIYQQNENKQWQLMPQAQAVFNSYKTRDSYHESGLNVSGARNNSVETRLGARLTYANRYENDKAAQPFVELNWLHTNAKNSIDFNEINTFNDDIPSNRYEVKVGVEGQLAPNWTLWGHVAHQMGTNDYSGDRAVLGVKYQWK